MPSASDTVDQARALLERRLKELDDERRKVQSALAGLGRRRGPGRPRGSGRQRRRRSGGRADQAVKIIGDNPGSPSRSWARRCG